MKESMKAREVERKTAKYEKRKALLEAGDFVGLQKLPKKTLHLFVYTIDVKYR
jgi:hypothetical protein